MTEFGCKEISLKENQRWQIEMKDSSASYAYLESALNWETKKQWSGKIRDVERLI